MASVLVSHGIHDNKSTKRQSHPLPILIQPRTSSPQKELFTMSDSEGVQQGVERLSLHNDTKEWHPINEHWVYGFHLKHRVFHRVARKLGLPWTTDPGSVSETVDDHIGDTSGVPYSLTTVHRRGRCSLIVTFAEDDGRKRSEKIKFSPQAMDRVRRAMMLPKGTQPKWYDTTGKEQDGDTELSSDDEEWPNNEIMTTTRDTIELMKQAGALDVKTYSVDEGIPRGALIGF